jgi:MFS family permease
MRPQTPLDFLLPCVLGSPIMSDAETKSERVTGPSLGDIPNKPLLIGLLLAVTLHATDELAIATVLPLISREFDGAGLYGIAFAAYLLTSLITIVWSGHVTDEKGPTTPFVVGLIIFAVGLAIAAVAPNMEIFVLSRAVQGVGAGAFSAVVYASINKTWSDEERNIILPLLSAAWVLPGLIAPAAAGAIAEFSSWRLIFVLLLPLTLLTGVLALKQLRSIKGGKAHDTGTSKSVDAVRIALGVTLLIWGISRPLDYVAIGMAVAGIAICAMPLRRVMPPGAGHQRQNLWAALAVKFLLVFAFFGADAFLPLGLIEIHHLTAFGAGVVLTLASLSWSAASFWQAKLAKDVSPQKLTTLGSVVVAVSIVFLLPLLIEGAPYWISYIAWTISGAGVGLVYTTLSSSAMAHTIKGKEGATSTAIGIAEALSIALVTGIGGAILNFAERRQMPLEYSLGAIWSLCIIAMFFGGFVSWKYLETVVRKTMSVALGKEP